MGQVVLRALLCGLLATPAQALELSRSGVEIPAGTSHDALWLTNDEATEWTGHATVYRWNQPGQGDTLDPADDLAVSPARLHILPGQRQRLRIVRLGPAPERDERAYRLLIAPQAGTAPGRAERHSLPVFLQPMASARPLPLQAALLAGPGQPPRLWLYNGGTLHARLADLTFIDAQGHSAPVLPGLAGYVLAGSGRSWPLPPRDGGYAGGGFRARLADGSEAVLTPAPAIAPPALSGL